MFTSLARIGTPESVETVLPFLRSDDALCARAPATPCVAMKDVAWPLRRGVAAATTMPTFAFSPASSPAPCRAKRPYASAATLLDSEQEANVCAAAVDVLAEIGGPAALPALPRCAERFATTHFSGSRSRPRPTGSTPSSPLPVPDSRRSPKTNFVGFANSSIDVPGWSSPKRNAITSSGAWSSGCLATDRARSQAISRGCVPTCRARSSSSSTHSPSTKRISIAKITSSRASRPICWPHA